MAEAQVAANSDTLYCTVHPTVETALRCNKCGRPMCIKCSVRTPIGYRCKECIKGQQAVFDNATGLDLVKQAAASLIFGVIAGIMVSFIGSMLSFWGWLLAIPAGAFAGALISDMALRVSGRRRSQRTWVVIAAGLVVGALLSLPTILVTNNLIGLIIYGFAATSVAIGNLRFRRY
jgi:hypothetical protein